MEWLELVSDGKIVKGILAVASGTADNSGGAEAADIDVTITFTGFKKVNKVLAAYTDSNAAGAVVKSISDNSVTATAKSVGAGATSTVTVVALVE